MKKRSSKEEKLGDVLQKFIHSSNLYRPFLNHQIQIQFEEIMGPFLMKKVKKIFVKENKLYLKLDSAPFKQEISIQKTKLISLGTISSHRYIMLFSQTIYSYPLPHKQLRLSDL